LSALAACKAPDIVYEPRPDDVIDGRRSALEAGVNTEMDYGPKQSLLLKSYQEAQSSVSRLQKELDELRRGKQATETRLADESALFAKEKALRVQAEAEAESLRGKRRELEARILSLGIEKAKLEQSALQSRIAYPSARAASSTARTSSGKYGFSMSVTISPSVSVVCRLSERATPDGR